MARNNLEVSTPFHKWLDGAPAANKNLLAGAADSLVSALAVNGFRKVRAPFDGSGAHGHTIDIERDRGDLVDFILIVFDKYYRLRFQVRFGTKGASPPHPWVRSASLVWNSGSESVKYQWWGAKWWDFSKSSAFIRTMENILKSLPQVHSYLNQGEIGTCIQEHKIGERISG